MAFRNRICACGEQAVAIACTLLVLEIVCRIHSLFGLAFSVVLLGACIFLLARRRQHG